ncbi:ORM1-like protein 2 [Hibiscus syriacus]|uniref:ORM1-like protein 2 n=1 Tax=Hibiscus syriacus TaxID=106335 RepID=UPI001924C2B9|nr:ORM1-like protein 2 [Hibiscus syriacus]
MKKDESLSKTMLRSIFHHPFTDKSLWNFVARYLKIYDVSYVKTQPLEDLNRNTDWFMHPGVILFFAWLLILSIFGCSPGMAWTNVNLSYFVVTCRFFHRKKGNPFTEDQGKYNGSTWREQMDYGNQLTPNRKFLAVALYLIESHTTAYQHQMLVFNGDCSDC